MSNLPCIVKGEHAVTITVKEEEDGVLWGYCRSHCEYCGKDLTGARINYTP